MCFTHHVWRRVDACTHVLYVACCHVCVGYRHLELVRHTRMLRIVCLRAAHCHVPASHDVRCPCLHACHQYYAVSGIGAVLHTLNPRLFPHQIEYIMNHAEDVSSACANSVREARYASTATGRVPSSSHVLSISPCVGPDTRIRGSCIPATIHRCMDDMYTGDM